MWIMLWRIMLWRIKTSRAVACCKHGADRELLAIRSN